MITDYLKYVNDDAYVVKREIKTLTPKRLLEILQSSEIITDEENYS